MEGRSILSDGLRWSIGNGVSVNIDKDPWIPIPGDFKARRVAIDDNFVTLNQLIHTETMSWKVEEVNRLFVPEHMLNVFCMFLYRVLILMMLWCGISLTLGIIMLGWGI